MPVIGTDVAGVSYGYPGSIDAVAMASHAQFLGAPYGVGGAADWKVTAVAGVDRTVRIAAGTGYGHFVRDVTTEATTVQLPSVASGKQWHAVVARRDWGTGQTTFMHVVGGATAATALTARVTSPGVVDDQVLALVEVTAGQQVPTTILDARTWPAKVVYTDTLIGLNAAEYPIGTEVRFRNEYYHYQRVVNDAGLAAWDQVLPPIVDADDAVKFNASNLTWYEQTVSFKAGKFPGPPVVVAQLQQYLPNAPDAKVYIMQVTNTGFTFQVGGGGRQLGLSTIRVGWQAILA